MQIFFIDDAGQRNCRRGISDLLTAGGLMISADVCRELDRSISALCVEQYGFPTGEPFKWSPSKSHWMREGLVDARRTSFFRDVLKLAKDAGAKGIAAISEQTAKPATGVDEIELDVLQLALERFNTALKVDETGLVIVARPSGGRTDEDKFLGRCSEIVETGTFFAKFDRLATTVLTLPFERSRLLQVADLVASILTAYVAGSGFADAVAPDVISLLRHDGKRLGGVGVKLHPDFRLLNLYHWLFDDQHFVKGNTGFPLPRADRPFFKSADVF